MLIVSGGDLVGKSTFVRKAYERLNDMGFTHMPFHLTRPPRNFDYYRGYLNLISPYKIWDRFALDAIAYRKLDDYPCSITPMKWSLVEASCRKSAGYQIVLFCNDDDAIRKRYAERKDQEHMYDVEHAVRVNGVFRDMCLSRSIELRNRTYRYTIDHYVATDAVESGTDLMWIIDAYVTHFNEWRRTR